MRRFQWSLIVGLVGVAVLAVVGCGAKGGDGAQKKAGFEPGKLVTFEEKTLGFSILRPENVNFVVSNNIAVLEAKGFAKVTVTLHKTQELSTGSGGSGGMGRYKFTVWAPARKLVCRFQAGGKLFKIAKQICQSLKNTKDAPKKLSVKFEAPKITGKLTDGDGFAKALRALEPRIVQCWHKAVATDAKFPQGHLNFMLEYKTDGSVKQSNISRTFNYKAHMPLTSCVEKLVLTVKPKPDGGEVKLGWYLRFKLY
jgi:hypothetical protein